MAFPHAVTTWRRHLSTIDCSSSTTQMPNPTKYACDACKSTKFKDARGLNVHWALHCSILKRHRRLNPPKAQLVGRARFQTCETRRGPATAARSTPQDGADAVTDEMAKMAIDNESAQPEYASPAEPPVDDLGLKELTFIHGSSHDRMVRTPFHW